MLGGLAAAGWLLCPAAAAYAQEEAPASGPAAAAGLDPAQLVNGLRDGFTRLPERIASALWAYTGGLALKTFASVVGAPLALVRWLAHGALGDVNLFTQIPEPWVTLAALDALRARLVPVALALGGLAGALVLLRWGAALAFGWAFPGWALALVKLAALVPVVGCEAQEVRPGYAARSYTWCRPPRTGRAMTCPGAVPGGRAAGAPGTGGTRPRLRWGRAELQQARYSRGTASGCHSSR